MSEFPGRGKCPNFQGGANARFDPCADAHGLDVPRVQNCLLEFSVKAQP